MNVNRKRSSNEPVIASSEKRPRLSLCLEDNTAIRTIEVGNLPTDVGEGDCKLLLRGYFHRDGPLEKIEIVKKTNNEWLGYVTFVFPDDAARLILNKDTPGYIRCSLFPIRMADDAYQIKIDPNGMSLGKVNDHCLLHIMSYLELMDVISLRKTSTRLQSVARLFYRRYSRFSFGSMSGDSSINETNLPVILEEIGDHIWFIDWQHLTGAQFELLAKYCPNVTAVKMSSPKDINRRLKEKKTFFANLNYLCVENSENICDGDLETMMSGKKIKTLHLNRCGQICGKFIQNINQSHLQILQVYACPNMEDPGCFPLAEWKNKLTRFAYDACCSHEPFFKLPPESLGELQYLYVDFTCFNGDTEGFHFSGLKKLKELRLIRKYQPMRIDANSLINELIQINSYSLQSLYIQGITIDSQTIKSLGSVKNLRPLRLYQVDNKIDRNMYQLFPEHLPMLQELAMYLVGADVFTGKGIGNMVVGMPKLTYFSHSSMTWELLEGICQAKPASVFDKKRPLKIGVGEEMLRDPKKESFEAAHNGAIILSIQK